MKPRDQEHLKLLISCDMHAQNDERVDWEYQKCIQAAARTNGWDCLVLVPRGAVPLPGWAPVLPRVLEQDSALRRFWANTLPLARAVARACRPKAESRAGRVALMAQSVSGYGQILGYALAAVLLRRYRPHLMIVIRKPIDRSPAIGAQYLLADALLRAFRIRSTYFTDTESLAKSLDGFLGRELTVLPIPHADCRFPDGPRPSNARDALSPIVCWWPGRPRPEKGLQTVRLLAQTRDDKFPRIRLMVSAASGIVAAEGGLEVRYLPDGLDRKSYLSLMERVHLVLLPYDVREYAQRSSGIFVEAVAAGKPAAAPAGTWMAQELQRHGLGRFAWDWQSANVPELIRRAVEECRARDVFAPLRKEYHARHNPARFAAMLEASW